MASKKHKYYLYLHDGTMEGDCDEACIPTDDLQISMRDVKAIMGTKFGLVCAGWGEKESDISDDELEEHLEEGGQTMFKGGWLISADAPLLSSYAQQVLRKQGGNSNRVVTLSPKQTELVFKKMPKYARQLESMTGR